MGSRKPKIAQGSRWAGSRSLRQFDTLVGAGRVAMTKARDLPALLSQGHSQSISHDPTVFVKSLCRQQRQFNVLCQAGSMCLKMCIVLCVLLCFIHKVVSLYVARGFNGILPAPDCNFFWNKICLNQAGSILVNKHSVDPTTNRHISQGNVTNDSKRYFSPTTYLMSYELSWMRWPETGLNSGHVRLSCSSTWLEA